MDILISGVGTGGTITGVAEVLKARKPSFRAVAVEPAQSPVLTQTLAGQPLKPGPHKIQGIGAGFVPKVLNLKIVDEVMPVDQDEALDYGPPGGQGGGAVRGHLQRGGPRGGRRSWPARPENAGKMIVAIIPSFGERYLSHGAVRAPGRAGAGFSRPAHGRRGPLVRNAAVPADRGASPQSSSRS